MRHMAVLLSLLAVPALADGHNAPADIRVACNTNGAVVTDAKGQVYYLGKSCDAFAPGLGEGRWWWAASAFVVEVGGRAIRFAGEVDCPALPYCNAS